MYPQIWNKKEHILLLIYIEHQIQVYKTERSEVSRGAKNSSKKSHIAKNYRGFFWKFALVNIVKGTKWNIFEIFNKTVCIMHYIAMDKTYWTSIYVMLSSKSKKNRYVPDKFMFITKK